MRICHPIVQRKMQQIKNRTEEEKNVFLFLPLPYCGCANTQILVESEMKTKIPLIYCIGRNGIQKNQIRNWMNFI